MRRSLVRNGRFLLPLAALLLAGPWAEVSMAASVVEKAYAAAVAVEGRGDLDAAEALYRQLMAAHSQSIEAEDAGRQIERIELRRKQLHRLRFMPVLHRLREIVLSYRLMVGCLPASFADFEDDGSLFTADYLAQIVPPGFVAYLELQGEEDFQLYALQDGHEQGYRVDCQSAVLQDVSLSAFMADLGSEMQVLERYRSLVLIRSR